MRRPIYDRSFVCSFNQSNALEVQEKETGLEKEYHHHQLGAIQENAPNRIDQNDPNADRGHRLG